MARKIVMSLNSYRELKQYPIAEAIGPKESYSDDLILVPIEEASFEMLQLHRTSKMETLEDLARNYMNTQDKVWRN